MWIEHGFEHLTLEQPTGLTIGAFDGVHLGHQALIRWLVDNARGAGWAPVVLTFDPLPRQVFDPDAADLLSDLDDRLPMFADLGVDGVVVQPFDEEVAAIPPRAFAAQLRTHLNLRGLWVGPDFALGRERTGDVAALQAIGEEQGFEVHVFDEVVRWGGAPVRSSRIRRAVRAGDVAMARGCLGRPYRLTGQVARGDQRGRTLGLPHRESASALGAIGARARRLHLPGASGAGQLLGDHQHRHAAHVQPSTAPRGGLPDGFLGAHLRRAASVGLPASPARRGEVRFGGGADPPDASRRGRGPRLVREARI